MILWQTGFGLLDYKTLTEIVNREGVPVSLVYSAEDIFNDAHYAARKNIIEMPHPRLGSIKMPGIFPHFSNSPGQVNGPELKLELIMKKCIKIYSV